jgi:uncharacterized membrane protein HdeD (DUF308 family)
MGGTLIVVGVIALLFSRSKKRGWDRDCLIGGIVAIIAGIITTTAC